MSTIKTGISTAYWCSYSGSQYHFEKAVIPSIIGDKQVSWFDELFEGGIEVPDIPEGQKRALTILISGPPGSGKSTLAMELVYRLFEQDIGQSDAWHTLYITSECSEDWLLSKARSYGWNIRGKLFHSVEMTERSGGVAHIDLLGTDAFKEYLENCDPLDQTKCGIFRIIGDLFRAGSAPEEAARIVASKAQRDKINALVSLSDPNIVVIDSLNTVQDKDKSLLFNKFSKLTTAGPRIIVIILDSNDTGAGDEFWAYVCDTVIRLGKRYDSKYMIRTIEIIKARYQSHVWGVHQLKLYGPTKPSDRGLASDKRAHPYREEGGIFIFPSIHFYLSKYKREHPMESLHRVSTKPEALNEVLLKGFPRGRCVGLLGLRGGHKSHLGYLHILHRIVEHPPEMGLVISLRDDEGMTKATMRSILKEEFAGEELAKFEDRDQDRLEILYYPPGYITPEEFFHRMYISIQRLKKRNPDGNITLLFNSLDQLSSRFPLCAAEKIFIPGIIEVLMAEDITSIFVGVKEPGQPPEQYGLLSMADVILSFERRIFKQSDYLGHIKEQYKFVKKLSKDDQEKIRKSIGNRPSTVVLQVERFSGGQAAGDAGLLELVKGNSTLSFLYGQSGLCYTKLSPNFGHGDAAI